jgi:tetratricopeptide (TPR) repeat protein
MRDKARSRNTDGEPLPLFGSAMESLQRACGSVEALELDRALGELKQYLQVFPSDTEVVNALSSLQWLVSYRPKSHALTEEELFTWWRRIAKEAERSEVMDSRLYRHLKRGILRSLIARMVAAGKKRLGGVPIGIFYFEAELYEEAIRELRLAAGERPDASSILGPLAEAEYRAGQHDRAAVSYSLALLYEPQKCGFREFSLPAINVVQAKLEKIGLDSDLARANLLVQCWLEGVLPLAPLPSVISLQDLLRRARALAPEAVGYGRLVRREDAELFRWCLQISEWIRAEPRDHEEDLVWAREQMRLRDARAFQIYMERLRIEELQSEKTVEVYRRPPAPKDV